MKNQTETEIDPFHEFEQHLAARDATGALEALAKIPERIKDEYPGRTKFSWAKVHALRGSWGEAEYLARELGSDSSEPEVHEFVVEALVAQERAGEAQEYRAEVASRLIDDASACIRDGDPRGAGEYLRTAVQLHSGSKARFNGVPEMLAAFTGAAALETSAPSPA